MKERQEILNCMNEILFSVPHSPECMQIQEQIDKLHHKITTFFKDHICLEKQKVKEKIIVKDVDGIGFYGVQEVALMEFSYKVRKCFNNPPHTPKERDEIKQYLLNQFVYEMEEALNNTEEQENE